MGSHMMHYQQNAGKRAKSKADRPFSRPSGLCLCRESSQVADSQLPLASKHDAKSINNEDTSRRDKHPADCSRIPGQDGFGVGG